MTPKSILCIFGGSQNELNALNMALVLGRNCNAHVRFLHISPDPVLYAAMYGCGETYTYSALIEACEKENKEKLRKAKQYVVSLCAKHHVPLDEPNATLHHASARFIPVTGESQKCIARAGRLSDLIIMGRPDASALYDQSAIAALFDTARPVVIMPGAETILPSEWKDKVVAIAWDGGLEASRALFNALPLIEKAEAVHVLVAREHGKAFDLEAEQEIITYLGEHGLNAHVIVSDRGEHSAGESLLQKAKELRADLLVMGGYGHSRMREMVLGGVTNHMLEKADLPLLISH